MKILVTFFLLFSLSFAKEVSDMLGRNITVPVHVDRAFSASPPMMVLLYTLAPQKLIGVNYKFLPVEQSFMLQSVRELPVLGGFFGGGNQASMEKLLSLKPDVVFAWDSSKKTSQEFENTLAKFNIPVVYIRQNSLEDSLEALEIMSEFLGTQQRAKELIAYGQRNLNLVKQSVAKLSNTKKPSVYFAQGNDGLMTECANDIRSEVVNFSGGINPHKCPNLPSGAYKREKITIEQLYKYDPDVIFVREKLFFESIKDLKSWHNLKAYKTNNIYLMPSSPFSWLNRPPSLVRLLGIVWMHHILYKEHFKVDMKKEIADFYKLFLHVELDSNQIDKLLKGE